MTEERTRHYLREAIGERGADVVISDMAPNMTGEYALDHARSVHLARQAFDVAEELLAPGGDFVVKVFQGEDLDAFREDVRAEFEYLRTVSPPAFARLLLGGVPRRQGAEHRPRRGRRPDRGDGRGARRRGRRIAYVEGYSIFVSDADVGETVTVEVVDAKPRFGFATREHERSRFRRRRRGRSKGAVSGDGILGSLSLVGLLSLCCIGLGGIAGGAAVAGGAPRRPRWRRERRVRAARSSPGWLPPRRCLSS